MLLVILHGRLVEKVLAVGVKPEVPEADRCHEAVRLLQLAIDTEEGINELDTGALVQLAFLLGLDAGAKHGGFASLEQLAELVREPVAGLDELVEHLTVLLGADLAHHLLGTLDLARELDEKEPKLTGLVANGRTRAVMVHGPVINPFAEGVGVKDTAKEHDGLLSRVPVLKRVTGRDPVTLAVGVRRGTGRARRGRLLVRAGSRGPSGLRPLRYRSRGPASVGGRRRRATAASFKARRWRKA